MIVFCFVCFRCMLCAPFCCSRIRHVEHMPETIVCKKRSKLFAWTHFRVLVHAHWSHLVQLVFYCVFILYCCLFTTVLFFLFLCFFLAKSLRRVVRFLHFHWFNISHKLRVAAAGVFYCAVSFLLLSLCVDVLLVCAEGCTQVTGVTAMMMTGRVLLVCALCVLWCVTPGGRCDEGKMAGSGSGGERDVSASGTPQLVSKELVTSPQETQELNDGPTDVKVKVPPAPSPSLEEDDDDNDDDDDSEEEEEKN
ncbi:hypothetical protein TCDM_13149 [Trypanosoma cruzi Dm28c]|uniref:Mucin-associated surface protein (MASP) n=1 Tax=Trypanosoma cruzi Dm28c TaxID=1416333 RepID=V5CJ34_TRYCR|nr:hypothetical protein TCDM_13149 [Trypanosoma cruzi Dm28c]